MTGTASGNRIVEAVIAAPLSRRGGRLVGGLAIAGLLCIVMVAAAVLVASHRREIEDTKQHLSTLDALLAEETSRAFQNVDLVLGAIVQEVRREGIGTPEALAGLRSGREAHEMLAARSSGVPQLDAINLIGADGHLINFSRRFPVPVVNVSDREYFRALAAAPSDVPFLSAPVRSRGTGTWTIYVARRLSAADGTFLGLVLGAVNLAYFDSLYQSLGLEKGMALSLWRRDGTLLARYPTVDRIGDRLSPEWVNDLPDPVRGTVYETPSNLDRHQRIVASRLVPGFDAVVSASNTREAALAEWWLLVGIVAAASGLAALAVAVVAFLLVRQFKAYDALADAVDMRDRAEANLRQAQKMEAVGHLTGGIAHDFNNMLAIVVGSLDVLRRRMARGEGDLTRFVDSALDGANRAASLTQRLLAFSRQQPLDPSVIEADAFVRGLQDLFTRTLGRTPGKGLELRFLAESGGWRIQADATQLENALLNLALNARDAMPDGGVLTIAARRVPAGGGTEGDHVGISVSDTGTGMTPEVMSRALEPFFTTKEVGRGTGLGLSQVHGFVAQSGGVLDMTSSPGEGTSALIRLPRTFALPRVGASGLAIPRALHEGEGVLVVDDEEGVRKVAVEMLRDLGYSVVQAGGASDALREAAGAGRLSLLLTDIVMPGMDGRALADEVVRRHPSVGVLYTTGYARDALDDAGDAPVLAKPFDLGSLSRAVRDAIDRTHVLVAGAG